MHSIFLVDLYSFCDLIMVFLFGTQGNMGSRVARTCQWINFQTYKYIVQLICHIKHASNLIQNLKKKIE